MEPAVEIAARLRRLARRELTDDDRDWLAHGATVYVADPENVSFEKALGLVPDRGGELWFRAKARAERDALIRQLVESFCPDRSARQQAAWAEAVIRRYAAAAWLRDRRSAEPPPYPAGSEKALLFEAFSRATMPMEERQIRRILQSGDGLQWAPILGEPGRGPTTI